jgi:hypothetical protein
MHRRKGTSHFQISTVVTSSSDQTSRIADAAQP